MGLKTRLAIMMFLQYSIWGVWAPVLAKYLGGLESFREDTGFKINMVYITMAIASMISPLISGQLADRYFATEKFLAFAHLGGGLTLWWASEQQTFEMFFVVMLVHSMFYAPTVPLTNSLAFANLPNAEKDFGNTRLFGTIGWIAVGFFLGQVWMTLFGGGLGDSLKIGAVISFVMAAYCLTLPHTPPKPSAANPFAFLGAIRLAKDKSFAVLLIVAFLVSTELQFYYVMTPNYFGDKSGPSLSSRQLILAADFKGDNAKNDATLLMRQLDLDRNNKLSKAELEAASERKTELEALLVPLEGESNGADKARLTAIVGGLGQGVTPVTVKRSAEAIAGYVLTAADNPKDPDSRLTATELKTFVGQIAPLGASLATVSANFDTFATDKGGQSLADADIPIAMLFGQIMEIVVLLILPFALKSLGFGITIAIGIAAWAVRYALFAMNDPGWVALSSQALHGFGFGFFFVAAMIYSDRIATTDIRASAQSLLIFVTYGAGMVVSSLIAGPVADYFEFDWHKIFLVPVAITVLCTLLFLVFFREKKFDEPTNV